MIEKLIELLRKTCDANEDCNKPCYECLADGLVANGVRIPVFCKDCIHRFDDGTCLNIYSATNCRADGIICVKDTDYCSYGERRNDG